MFWTLNWFIGERKLPMIYTRYPSIANRNMDTYIWLSKHTIRKQNIATVVWARRSIAWDRMGRDSCLIWSFPTPGVTLCVRLGDSKNQARTDPMVHSALPVVACVCILCMIHKACSSAIAVPSDCKVDKRALGEPTPGQVLIIFMQLTKRLLFVSFNTTRNQIRSFCFSFE